MAQQHKQSKGRTPPSKDRQGADKDRHPTPDDDNIHEEGEYKYQHFPLRDPSEGRSPAVIGQNVSYEGDFQGQADVPQPPVMGVAGEPIEDGERDPDTIAEEQRRRAEEMQEVGIVAWMGARDSRTDEQWADSQFVAEEEKPRRSDNRRLSYRDEYAR